MRFIVVQANPNGPILAQEIAEELEAGIHEIEPSGMLQIVVVVLECGPGVVWRVDINALHLSGIKRQQGLKCLQIVAVDKDIVPRPV